MLANNGVSISFEQAKAHIQTYLKNLQDNVLDKDDHTELYLLFVNCFQVIDNFTWLWVIYSFYLSFWPSFVALFTMLSVEMSFYSGFAVGQSFSTVFFLYSEQIAIIAARHIKTSLPMYQVIFLLQY